MHHFSQRRAAFLSLLGGFFLFGVNCYVCQKLFGTEYLRHMHSIEGAYIAISRYAMENWWDLSWFPLWYAGIPYQNTYPPLLHLLVALVAKLATISPALSYHAVNAFLYCLGPVTLYWMALRLTGSRSYSMLAGLLYSLVSPAALLIPTVRTNLGGMLLPNRLHTLVFNGDGPFVSSLTVLPLAILCLDLAVKKRSPLSYLLAALAMASVVLTNWLGGAVLAFAVLAYWIGMSGELPERSGLSIIGTALLAYLLASPWIPPSTVNTIRNNAQTLGGYYSMTPRHLFYWGLVLGAVALLHLFFRRLRTPGWLRMPIYLLLFTGALTFMWEWFGISLLPQPHRYHPAVEMALCLAAGLLARPLFDRAPGWSRLLGLLVVLAFFAAQLRAYHRFAAELIQPIDIRTTTEYKTAAWLDRHMGGNRVMTPGSTSFYFNIFTDTPQLGGGFEQGDLNWENRIALYTIYSGQNAGALDAEISTLWLKAFGVQAVGVGGPKSGEHYKPFLNPGKFSGLLSEIWRDGDDHIYAVPNRSTSLAHVMRKRDLVRSAPIHGLDVGQLRRYVAALDDPSLPLADMRWTSRHSGRIVADMARDHILSVQVTYHPGWRAEAGSRPLRVRGDGIGLMVIEPDCRGRCTIDIDYDGGIESKLANSLSLGALVVCLAWAFVRKRRGRKRV